MRCECSSWLWASEQVPFAVTGRLCGCRPGSKSTHLESQISAPGQATGITGILTDTNDYTNNMPLLILLPSLSPSDSARRIHSARSLQDRRAGATSRLAKRHDHAVPPDGCVEALFSLYHTGGRNIISLNREDQSYSRPCIEHSALSAWRIRTDSTTTLCSRPSSRRMAPKVLSRM